MVAQGRQTPIGRYETSSNPVPLMEDVLIYNAVPKCGSTSFNKLVNILSKRNGFNFQKQTGWRGYTNSDWSLKRQVRPMTRLVLSAYVCYFALNWQRGLIREVLGKKRPFALQKHLHFLNFTQESGSTEGRPIYINFLRDPVCEDYM